MCVRIYYHVGRKLSLTFIAPCGVHSRSMLIKTLCDHGGPTGGGVGVLIGDPVYSPRNTMLYLGDRYHLYLIVLTILS